MQFCLGDFQNVVFFTGAGISAESGVPVYRGPGGIWDNYNWQDVACQKAFDRNPEAVLEFHQMRRSLALQCLPNKAHAVIAEFQRRYPRTNIITQNIDGLHHRAGADPVVELHGSLWRQRCDRCSRQIENDYTPDYPQKKCSCGRWLRPAITWFCDSADSVIFQTAGSIIDSCDCFIAVGTSGVVWPAAGLQHQALRKDICTIEVNVEPTELSNAYDYTFRAKAGIVLPLLVNSRNFSKLIFP